jgi:nucleoside-diphosphate-sugar epimerase
MWAGIGREDFDWGDFDGKSILFFGASGTIGRCFIDAIMGRNRARDGDIRVVAAGRSGEGLKKIFEHYMGDPHFSILQQDVNVPISGDTGCDFIIHAAGNTHPVQYASEPIGTILANIIGTKHILDYAAGHKPCRVLFMSSVEVYGENRGDTDPFKEGDCGYIDCNTLRAGYPESKRAGEALCQAYIAEKQADAVIARLARVYGYTMTETDSKAVSQLIRNALKGEDIVLKSAGTQIFSYLFVEDAVTAMLCILSKGKTGEAYNVAGDRSDISLRDLAGLIAETAGTKVVFERPGAVEAAGFSKVTKGVLDTGKLKQLGWRSAFDIRSGIAETIRILRR